MVDGKAPVKNIVETVDLYCDFVSNYEEYRTPDYFVRCAADTLVNYWRLLLFVPAESVDADDAAKAEELLIHVITTDFSDEEKRALQEAARLQLEQRFEDQDLIDPEDETQNRERRFLTFIATGRFEDMDLL